MTISVVINTLNEENNIRGCLESAIWADEIVIVDMYSEDKTVAIAREFTDKIYFHEKMGFADPARNFAIGQAQNEWILVLDADERIPSELRDEILKTIKKSDNPFVYRILIRDYMFGKWVEHGIWNQQWQIRFFKKGYAHWSTKVHTQPEAVEPIGYLKNPCFHYSQISIACFIAKLNNYTNIMAQEWYEQGIRKSLFSIFAGTIVEFFKEYIYRQSFRDGGHGLILSVLWTFNYFAPRAKLWELHYKETKDALQPPPINYKKMMLSANAHKWRVNLGKRRLQEK